MRIDRALGVAAFSLLITGGCFGAPPPNTNPPAAVLEAFPASTIRFEPNVGQADAEVRYLGRGGGYLLALTAEEAILSVPQGRRTKLSDDPVALAQQLKEPVAPPSLLRMRLVGAARNPQARPVGRLESITNYYLGSDPSRWRPNVPNYARVELDEVYPGVALVYYGQQGRLEYDFVLAPFADPEQIRIAYSGADRMRIDASGDLLLETGGHTITQCRPRVYQELGGRRVEVAGNYRIEAGEVRFSLASYDRSRPLVIDPVVLVFSTYLGGNLEDAAFGISIDQSKAVYATGWTFGALPQLNAAQAGFGGGRDAFMSKFSPTGSLVYSTYIGGSSYDAAFGINVDGTGAAYITGFTGGDFPLLNATQPKYGGGSNDAFAVKLTPTGQLAYSTYLGGNTDDYGYRIAVDGTGAYITGYTAGGFPVLNATQPAFGGGGADAFVTKLSPTGAMIYSTYLGGPNADFGFGIAVDLTGAAYVTGATLGSFPVVNAAQSKYGGGQSDAFVVKLSPGGTVVYATYLGGAGQDGAQGIAADTTGAVYLTGQTTGGFSVVNAFQSKYAATSSDGFAARLNPDGTIAYATYLGSTASGYGYGINVDGSGAAYIAGYTTGSFPTLNAFQSAYGGGPNDGFIIKLNPSGSLAYSTLIGGPGDDQARGIAVDPSGAAYVDGQTSGGFPVLNAYQGSYGGGTADVFVAKVAPVGNIATSKIQSVSPLSAFAGQSFTLTVLGAGFQPGATVNWTAGVQGPNGYSYTTTNLPVSQTLGTTALAVTVPSSLVSAAGSALVTVTNPGENSSNAIFFTITAAATLEVSPATLSFSGKSGTTLDPLTILINSSSYNLPFDMVVSTTSGGDWLQVDYTSGVLPALVHVSANVAGLGAGTYQGSILIRAPGASPGSFNVAVTLTVSAGSGPKLGVDSGSVVLSVSGSPTTSQIGVRNAGSDTLKFTASASGGGWLTIGPGSNSVTSGSSSPITVNVDPTGLSPNVYRGKVTIQSLNSSDPPIAVGVTMIVTSSQPSILVSQTGLTFTAVEQAPAPLPQSVGVLNIGSGVLNWSASARTLTAGNWLGVSQNSGTVNRPYLDVSNFTVRIDPTGLKAGDYYGQVVVTGPGSDNSPQTISIVLNVLPAGSTPGPELRPSGLVFTGLGGTAPASQQVLMGNTVSLGFNSSRLTRDGQSWFTHTPGTSSITPGQPTNVVVQPDFTSLTPGIYRGAVQFLFDDGTIRNVSLLSVVAPPGAGTSPADKNDHREAGGCTPKALTITPTSAQAIVTARLGQPNPIEVVIVDDCGVPVTQHATVAVLFSNSDKSLSMDHVGGGKWTKTWQPVNGTAGTTVQAKVVAFLATATDLIGATTTITTTLASGAAVPLVAPGGVVNGASYAGDSPVAPGSLIAIYGQQLSSGAAGATSTPFPTTINDTTVTLGSRTLPLLYASGGQVNAQVPFDLPINSTQQLVVQRGGAISVPAPLTVAPAQPAIFTLNQQGFGQGAIVNGVTNVIADSKAPVTAGDVITIYCTGLGAVTPAIPNGAPAPTDRLVNTVNPVTVTVGGANAPVLFAGLAPGFAGLYQVNAQIPSGLAPGNSVPVALTVSSQTSPAATVAVK